MTMMMMMKSCNDNLVNKSLKNQGTTQKISLLRSLRTCKIPQIPQINGHEKRTTFSRKSLRSHSYKIWSFTGLSKWIKPRNITTSKPTHVCVCWCVNGVGKGLWSCTKPCFQGLKEQHTTRRRFTQIQLLYYISYPSLGIQQANRIKSDDKCELFCSKVWNKTRLWYIKMTILLLSVWAIRLMGFVI